MKVRAVVGVDQICTKCAATEAGGMSTFVDSYHFVPTFACKTADRWDPNSIQLDANIGTGNESLVRVTARPNEIVPIVDGPRPHMLC